MAGLLRSQEGGISCKGLDVFLHRPTTLQEMFLVPEEFALPSFILKQYLKPNLSFYSRFSHGQLVICLRDFDLSEDLHLGELSMGQKKKAFISFA